jgi:hypothetical protein
VAPISFPSFFILPRWSGDGAEKGQWAKLQVAKGRSFRATAVLRCGIWRRHQVLAPPLQRKAPQGIHPSWRLGAARAVQQAPCFQPLLSSCSPFFFLPRLLSGFEQPAGSGAGDRGFPGAGPLANRQGREGSRRQRKKTQSHFRFSNNGGAVFGMQEPISASTSGPLLVIIRGGVLLGGTRLPRKRRGLVLCILGTRGKTNSYILGLAMQDRPVRREAKEI